MNVEIKYLEDATRMERIEKGNWIDVYAYQDVFVPYMERKMVNLGFALNMPEGYEGHLVPRSSTHKTWGIIMTNSMGIIDDTYKGDNDIWHFPALSTLPEGSHIKKGDKIGQFRLIKIQEPITFIETPHFGNADRGGFGSTGKR